MFRPVIYMLAVAVVSGGFAGIGSNLSTTVASAQEPTQAPEAIAATIPLVISEFRVRGPNGANDEFIEIYNKSDQPHTVAGVGAGYAVAASDGVMRVMIPNGPVIPARGHFLGTNGIGYSLNQYASGDATYATDIPDNAGIALFNSTLAGNFTMANRIDAVGSVNEANAIYKEGTGLPTLTPFSIDYSWIRAQNNGCDGLPKDTNNNTNDFLFVDTNGTSAGGGQRLGAPGPQNLSKAVGSHPGVGGIARNLVDPGLSRSAGGNFVRDLVSNPNTNSTFGRIDIRRKFTNNTGVPLTSLRFRITDLTTFPMPNGGADLRPMTSADTVVSLSAAAGGGSVTVRGTTLDQNPNQPNGGGYNTSLTVPSITPATPLANGASIDVRLLFGLQETGNIRIGISPESFPVGDQNVQWLITGNTDPGVVAEPCSVNTRRGDLDGDGKAETSVWRDGVGTWYSLNSNGGAFAQVQFGASGDRIVPGDYDGDGITDLAVWRPSNSTYYVLRSSSGFTFFTFGLPGDLPAQGDFDGDGLTDYAVFRPSTGMWYLQQSKAGFASFAFGANGDKPVVGDYDNDSKADLAVFRPSNGTWYIQRSSAGLVGIQFGLSTDKVVPADYDGDGLTDIAVYRESAGAWYINQSSAGFTGLNFGTAGDIPAPADYDLDGKTNVAVFRPSTGTWYRISSSNTLVTTQFGANGDKPAAAGYVPVQ
jgi:hypothetical protein